MFKAQFKQGRHVCGSYVPEYTQLYRLPVVVLL